MCLTTGNSSTVETAGAAAAIWKRPPGDRQGLCLQRKDHTYPSAHRAKTGF